MDPNRIISDESETWSYNELAESLWPASEFADGAVIAFAGLEDPSKLRKLVDKAAILSDNDWYTCLVDQHHAFKFVSPLLRAIERRRPENVSLLLEQDANPDGVWYERQVEHARRYRRFCSGDYNGLDDFEVAPQPEDVGTVLSQTEPPYLTDDELADRRTTISPFWTKPFRMVIDHMRDLAQWHSVVKAGASTPEILDLLLDAGADTTAWCESTDDSLPGDEEELLPSQLCISTPVHAAVASETHTMLRKLFDSGISPNARALITGNQALTPAQYAIMLGDLESYNLLVKNGADISITTPFFNVHALHFAAARLDIALMEAIRRDLRGPSSPAPVTNTGHTLLHIACLPFNRGHIQTSSVKILQSIHDIRYMSPVFKRASRSIPTYNDSGEEEWYKPSIVYQEEHERRLANRKTYPSSPWKWSRHPQKDHAKQEAVCKFIVATYTDSPRVSDQDKHGNNMLHYLAAARYPNTSLIDWARQQESGERAWESERNFWRHTAEDLYNEGEDARNSGRDAAYLEFLHSGEREFVLKG